MKLTLALILLSATFAVPAEQTCDTSAFPLSSPSSRFDDHGDGTVTDRETRLMWMRCALGQRWADGTCVGTAVLYTWDRAEGAAEGINASGTAFFNDWHVPHLRELASVTERQCENPRINLEIFPETEAGFHWTASLPAGSDPQPVAFALSFGPEGVAQHPKGQEHYVRLVRFDD
jgi:hypothetical protein